MKLHTICLFFIISSLIFNIATQDPITLGLVAGVIGIMMYFKEVKEGVKHVEKRIGQKLGYYEGCEDYWIPGNLGGLESDLRNNIFGQPLAVDTILGALRRHMDPKRLPTRPLVLSFHGSPGTGKNFISQKILKNMFRKGVKTEYVHFFRGSIDFPLKSNVDQYRRDIVKKVMSMVYECHRSIFVFDEVEKMPNGILDTLSGFVKAGRYDETYDYRRAIFILLSNIGEKVLYDTAVNAYKRGHSREDMDANHLNKVLMLSAFNSEGGLQRSGLISSSSITHYVPFLPLEREHVVQCLELEVKQMGQPLPHELVELVLDDITYIKPDNLFSASGCKNVGESAEVHIERQIQRQKRSERR